MSKRDDTFTRKEMGEAYERYLRGLPMSRKETMLAMARFTAIHAVNIQSEEEVDHLRADLAAADKMSRARVRVIEHLLDCLFNQGISLGNLSSELRMEVQRTGRGRREVEKV